MAAGKSGYITASGRSEQGGNFELRFGWMEEYDISTNESVVTLTSCEARYQYGGYFYPDGSVTVEGTEVVKMDYTGASHRFETEYGGEVWVPIRSWETGGAIPPWTSGKIAHNEDGSKTAEIGIQIFLWRSGDGIRDSVSIDTTVSIELTTIPRASEITSAADVTLGDACNVKWVPKMASYRYKLHFSLGNWSYTTDIIHPNKTTEYTYRSYMISLEAAEAIPNAKTGTMTVELYTYSDSGATEQIGNVHSATFMVTVPDNDSTRPDVSMILSPVSALPDAFAGLYIQGKTKIQAELSAFGQYDATIEAYSVKAENVTYDAEDSLTSEYLATNGETTITGYATDSRGFTGSISEVITVLPYIKPRVMAASGESDVIISRCDAEGNLIASGTYLKIKAKRSYSLLKSEGVQYNHCSIQYRYKLASAESYSDWVTILDGMSLASDEVDSDPLLGGVLSVKSTYMVEVRVIDEVGETGSTMIYIPTDKVYMHRTKNALGLGKYVEGENLLDVAWDAHFRGEVLIGETGMTLKNYILAVISEGG